MIIIEPCAGLGNKLLGLASAYTLAQKMGRKLLVIWKREVGCNVKAAELFDLPMDVVEISENGLKKEPYAHLAGNAVKKRYRKQATRFLECSEVEQIREEGGYEALYAAIEREPVIYIKSFGPICELGADCLTFLKPGREIEAKGRKLFQQIDRHTVGVHVRRTDHTEAIANSPISLFAERMKAECAVDCRTGFFVATDDPAVKEELKRLMPGVRLIFNESGIIDRNSREGLQDAFIEMLALSRCRKILGSYNSTFSLLPSYIGNIPLEVVKRDS